MAELRLELQLHGSQPSALCIPTPSSGWLSRIGEGLGEGHVSLPEGAVRLQLGELESGKLAPLEKLKPVDLVAACASSV